ncbi:hypothetical protein KUL25_02655 [Rhodobacteraceae bacterium N5(2021)]|uniref:Uncharacterized protein n=1 Tax=Gymnodinialimonas phycosphaerae TaxID=2841589 RepID=A0A975YGI5_9RHOB|nr:hypothetical protein [Gymnodinialimonas phycosphaerae]MBY4891661.1 hypothetical protein [Gymnodinialimonas phycosphaerae]
MVDMSNEAPKNGSKSLSDADIATFARRAGPSSGAPGTDADAHSDSDVPAAATDHDTAPAPKKPLHTDKDS